MDPIGAGRWFFSRGVDLIVENELQTFPNPAVDEITVVSPDPGISFEYYLVDPSGKLIRSFTNNAPRNQVDIFGVEAGIYFLKAVGGGMKYTSKIAVGH